MLFDTCFKTNELVQTRTEYVAGALVAAVREVRFDARRRAAAARAEASPRRADPETQLATRVAALLTQRLANGESTHNAAANAVEAAIRLAHRAGMDLAGAVSTVSFNAVETAQNANADMDDVVAGVLTGVRRFARGGALAADQAATLAAASAVRATQGNRTWDCRLADLDGDGRMR